MLWKLYLIAAAVIRHTLWMSALLWQSTWACSAPASAVKNISLKPRVNLRSTWDPWCHSAAELVQRDGKRVLYPTKWRFLSTFKTAAIVAHSLYHSEEAECCVGKGCSTGVDMERHYCSWGWLTCKQAWRKNQWVLHWRLKPKSSSGVWKANVTLI